MAETPDGISLARHRDLAGRGRHPAFRRAAIALACVVPALALLDVFGQRVAVDVSDGAAAALRVSAPSSVRGGLVYQVRLEVDAHATMVPTLVMSHGWFESMSINSVEPQPQQQSSRDGAVTMSFSRLRPGHMLVVWLYFQVNPTNIARRPVAVELDAGSSRVAEVRRTLTVWP